MIIDNNIWQKIPSRSGHTQPRGKHTKVPRLKSLSYININHFNLNILKMANDNINIWRRMLNCPDIIIVDFLFVRVTFLKLYAWHAQYSS